MDYTYEDRLTDHITLSLKPSENLQRRIYATFQDAANDIRMIGEIAPDNVMWASDYPHRDGAWPESQYAIEEQFGGVDETLKRKMLWGNVVNLYLLDV